MEQRVLAACCHFNKLRDSSPDDPTEDRECPLTYRGRALPTLARRALESGRAPGSLICADSVGASKRDVRAW